MLADIEIAQAARFKQIVAHASQRIGVDTSGNITGLYQGFK